MATTSDKSESGDAPLIDLNEASIKKLIARAKKRGVITYDELNEALPQDQMSSEQIEDIMAAISEKGVNIVEDLPPKLPSTVADRERIAQVFNAFYHRQQILNEPDATTRLWRAAAVAYTRRQLTDALDVMGCEVPARM